MDRTERLNSLLKEVLSEVIRRDLHHTGISEMTVITDVKITKDLRHAKVYISVIGDSAAKQKALNALTENGKTITHIASKKVVMRYFPQLTFVIDEGLEHQIKVQQILDNIHREENTRG